MIAALRGLGFSPRGLKQRMHELRPRRKPDEQVDPGSCAVSRDALTQALHEAAGQLLATGHAALAQIGPVEADGNLQALTVFVRAGDADGDDVTKPELNCLDFAKRHGRIVRHISAPGVGFRIEVAKHTPTTIAGLIAGARS